MCMKYCFFLISVWHFFTVNPTATFGGLHDIPAFFFYYFQFIFLTGLSIENFVNYHPQSQASISVSSKGFLLSSIPVVFCLLLCWWNSGSICWILLFADIFDFDLVIAGDPLISGWILLGSKPNLSAILPGARPFIFELRSRLCNDLLESKVIFLRERSPLITQGVSDEPITCKSRMGS